MAPTPRSYAYPSPAEALAALLAEVRPVGTERISLAEAGGRVLAEEIRTDRPSPACDVSAMDGYALRFADVRAGTLRVSTEAWIGQASPTLAPGSAARIVTGAPLPTDADTVIKREDVLEHTDRIEIGSEVAGRVRRGEAVRQKGENAPAGHLVLAPGVPIGPVQAAALAGVGAATPLVYGRVRVTLLVTGDELLPVSATPTDWQLRDSNGPALLNMFGALAYVDIVARAHARDSPAAITESLGKAGATSDLIFVTGGVSMGDRDYVPAALGRLGARTLFHTVPQRPGKPILGALLPSGNPVLALPGNPVSVMVTARRFGAGVARKLAGFADPLEVPRLVTLENPDDRKVDLWWHRPVRMTGAATATLVPNRGSGDIMGVSGSDGVVEIPPGRCGPGAWPFLAWSL